jgi:mono/diheme cytochrome c family protein
MTGLELTMRAVLTILIVFWMTVCSARAQEPDTAGDVAKGHHLAVVVCSICHVAAADQPTAPILHPPAPSFASIAQRNDIDAGSLTKFLTTTHRQLDTSKGMPNPNLADFQVKEAVAYILSLRK